MGGRGPQIMILPWAPISLSRSLHPNLNSTVACGVGKCFLMPDACYYFLSLFSPTLHKVWYKNGILNKSANDRLVKRYEVQEISRFRRKWKKEAISSGMKANGLLFRFQGSASWSWSASDRYCVRARNLFLLLFFFINVITMAAGEVAGGNGYKNALIIPVSNDKNDDFIRFMSNRLLFVSLLLIVMFVIYPFYESCRRF